MSDNLITWYRESFPESPLTDAQISCLRVLEHVDRLYNWRHRITGTRRTDGGFRPFGDGVQVRLRYGDLSTYDTDNLTRLVIAAHQHCVRVQVSATGGMLSIALHPRKPDGVSLYERHRSLASLRDAIDALIDACPSHASATVTNG